MTYFLAGDLILSLMVFVGQLAVGSVIRSTAQFYRPKSGDTVAWACGSVVLVNVFMWAVVWPAVRN